MIAAGSWCPTRRQSALYSQDRSQEHRQQTDPLASEPPIPNHLLTLKTQVVLAPPGKFESPNLYSWKRWRRVQYLANQFWLRWQKEYCTLLQNHQKWLTPKRSQKIMIGDVVLVCDSESPRNQWPLAVVTKVFPSQDNLVCKVQIMTTNNREKKFFKRPVHKLVLLLPKEDNKNWVVSSNLYIISIQNSSPSWKSFKFSLIEIFHRVIILLPLFSGFLVNEEHLGKQCYSTRVP